jgi:hypothetical protein
MVPIPMKRIIVVLAVLGLAAALQAQSLAELAKREKARRETFRGRHAVVIKNMDLLQVKKVPAVEVSDPAVMGDEEQMAEPIDRTMEIEGRTGLNPPQAGTEGTLGAEADGGGPLEDQLQVVDAVVENLTNEMNALRQQFEAQDNMVPGYVIQQQMDDLNQRLVKAQARQAAIRAKMEKQGIPVKKSPESPDR